MRQIAILVAISSATIASGQETPGWGQLYGLDEQASLAYECFLAGPDELHCIFGQTNIRITSGPAEIERIRQDMAAAQTAGEALMPADQCPALREAVAAMERGQSASDDVPMDAQEIEAALPMMRVLAEVCGRSDGESYRQATEAMITNAQGQCSIRTQTFEQTFTRTSPDTWVNAQPPTGECGIIRLDRFQRDPDAILPGVVDWMYISEKKVMGSGDPATDEARLCNIMDQTPYRFVTRTQDHLMNCRVINMDF